MVISSETLSVRAVTDGLCLGLGLGAAAGDALALEAPPALLRPPLKREDKSYY